MYTFKTHVQDSYAASSCGETTGRRPASFSFSKGEGPLRFAMKRPRTDSPMPRSPTKTSECPDPVGAGRAGLDKDS